MDVETSLSTSDHQIHQECTKMCSLQRIHRPKQDQATLKRASHEAELVDGKHVKTRWRLSDISNKKVAGLKKVG